MSEAFGRAAQAALFASEKRADQHIEAEPGHERQFKAQDDGLQSRHRTSLCLVADMRVGRLFFSYARYRDGLTG